MHERYPQTMASPNTSSTPGTDTAPAGPLGDLLHDLLWEVTSYTDLLGDAALAGTQLSLPSNGLLDAIVNEPGITVAEISRRIPKTQQAISQIVARLERLGFVERRVGPGRGIALYPTAAGSIASHEGVARELALEKRTRELLGTERYAALRTLLLETRAILRQTR